VNLNFKEIFKDKDFLKIKTFRELIKLAFRHNYSYMKIIHWIKNLKLCQEGDLFLAIVMKKRRQFKPSST